MAPRVLLSLLLVASAAFSLFVAVVVLARRRPGYSHARHTLSELGEHGATDQRLVGLGVFLPVGAALGAAAVALEPLDRPAALLATCIAVGYCVAAVFPCDPGSPASGSFRQAIHNLGGGVEYLGGAFALVRLAEATRQPLFLGLAGVVAASAIGISFPGPLRGAIQRAAEATLFAGLALGIWLR